MAWASMRRVGVHKRFAILDGPRTHAHTPPFRIKLVSSYRPQLQHTKSVKEEEEEEEVNSAQARHHDRDRRWPPLREPTADDDAAMLLASPHTRRSHSPARSRRQVLPAALPAAAAVAHPWLQLCHSHACIRRRGARSISCLAVSNTICHPGRAPRGLQSTPAAADCCGPRERSGGQVPSQLPPHTETTPTTPSTPAPRLDALVLAQHDVVHGCRRAGGHTTHTAASGVMWRRRPPNAHAGAPRAATHRRRRPAP